MDWDAFYRGECFDAWHELGAHRSGQGWRFLTYAPRAHGVSLMGDFSGWQEVPMQRLESGAFCLDWHDAREGQHYKYCIYGENGRVEHCDPFGFGMEGDCSVLYTLDYPFSDGSWMAERDKAFHRPVNIYELHLASWRKPAGSYAGYEGIAEELIGHLRTHGFNYVELMPLCEHSVDGSLGYLPTGLFAPSSRFGNGWGLKELINRLHRANIGVLLDVEFLHFAVDSYGLASYDGLPLYEKSPEPGEWGGLVFDHGRGETRSLLRSCAQFWLQEYHFDGLRLDAVSRMIYFGGEACYGDNEEGRYFLRTLTEGLRWRCPSAMIIAEDSTPFWGTTAPCHEGGLGFDYKWDMGWTHDIWRYMLTGMDHRGELREHFRYTIEDAERRSGMMALSHDMARPGLLWQLPGDWGQRIRQMRLLGLLLAVRPGKKLAFMGMEWAYDKGWDPNGELDWRLWNVPEYGAFDAYVCALAHFYLGEPALWQEEGSAGWRWADVWSDNPCVFGLVRIGWDRQVLALLNFSGEEARVWVGERTEAVLFDSTGRAEAGRDENGLLSLPALSGRVLRMA